MTMTPEPIPSAPTPANETPATAALFAFDAPTVPALATEQEPDDEATPDQPVMTLRLHDLLAASQPPEPPIWPVPWRAEDAAPWWRRTLAHGQGAWISTALAALLVLGLLGAGMALPLTPPSPASATTAHPTSTHTTSPHPTATKTATTIATTPLTAKPAPTVRPTQQPPATRSGSGGHGHKHK